MTDNKKDSKPVNSMTDKIETNICNESIYPDEIPYEESIHITELGDNELTNVRKQRKYKEINGYIKGEKLGKGSFATVREVIDKNTLKRCAVKIMKRNFLKKSGLRVQLNVLSELQLVGKLNHKNVINLIEVHREPTKIYLFMEYCVGVLSEIIGSTKDNSLPICQSHNYYCQLIDGLEYLHSIGLYHRDIKDENLLVNNSHVIKIADFGVSCRTDLFKDNDLISDFEGSKLYQPPELLGKDDQTVSDDTPTQYSGSKFDIWSAGVLLYRMISGGYPFFNNKEDLWSVKSYNPSAIKYPQIIYNDKQLLSLFQKIFVIDFEKRITIDGIKSHPWVQLKHVTEMDQFVCFPPPKKTGDIYRGMTLLERLRVRFEYQMLSDKQEFVNYADYEESLNLQNSGRSNRTLNTRTHRQRNLTPNRRMIRIGLTGSADDS